MQRDGGYVEVLGCRAVEQLPHLPDIAVPVTDDQHDEPAPRGTSVGLATAGSLTPIGSVPPIGLLAALIGELEQLETPLADAALDAGAPRRQQPPLGRMVLLPRNHALEDGGRVPHRTMSYSRADSTS